MKSLAMLAELTSKQSVKLAVVERAIYSIGIDAAPASKDEVSKLDKFLNTEDLSSDDSIRY